MHRYAYARVFAGPWSDCILCCATSCNISHCHWLTCHKFLQLPEQAVGSRVVYDGQRTLVVSSWFFLFVPLSSCPILVLQCF